MADPFALIAAAAVAAWAVLLFARGGFWRADMRLGRPPSPLDWPEVVAVIPARNEAATIAEVLAAHASTTYPGRFSVVVVDDGSDDGTGEIARKAADGAARPVSVVDAPPLPEGWTGKLAALEAGLLHAASAHAEARWVLLTDADIRHAPETLARLVAQGEAGGLAAVSLMARLDDRGLWGGLLVPAFVFFFAKLYPFAWIANPANATAGAAGGCFLVRRDALDEIGGIASIRGALIDDCTLAARLKRSGRRRAIWLGLATDEVVSLRDNRPLWSIWKMVARTAFAQLRHSALLLLGTLAGLALVYLAGPVLALTMPLHGSLAAALLGGLAWALSAVAYRPTFALFGRPAWQTLALPAAATLYAAMTVDSARRHWLGRGGAWKGRTYPGG